VGALSHVVEEEQYMKKWGIPCTAVLVTVVLFAYTASLVHLTTFYGEHL
jgi:hypothetical protein